MTKPKRLKDNPDVWSMTSLYAGKKCKTCDVQIKVGDKIHWNSKTKWTYHASCKHPVLWYLDNRETTHDSAIGRQQALKNKLAGKKK